MLQIGNCYVIDFSKVSDRNFFNLNIKSRDAKRYIDLQLVNNSHIVNLSDYTIVVKAIKQDGNIIFNDVVKTNPTEGRCKLEITQQMLAIGDKLPCEIILYGSDGTIASTSDFTLNIMKSSGDEEILSASEFTALSEALKTVASIEGIQSAVDTINNTLKALNIKGSSILGLDKLVANKIVSDKFYSKGNNHLYLAYDEENNQILIGNEINLNGYRITNGSATGLNLIGSKEINFNKLKSETYPFNQMMHNDGYNMYADANWDFQGRNILNPHIIGGTTSFSLQDNPKAKMALLDKDFSTQNKKGDEINVNINDIIKHLYLQNISLENEINQLKSTIYKHGSGDANVE